MYCENCKNEHTGTFGSGRFCSSKCARGFSTKEKRSLINEKVSLKLKKKSLSYSNICEYCRTSFISKDKKRTCNITCANKLQIGKKKIGNYSNNGGFRDNGGRSIAIEYVNSDGEKMKLNKEEIEVAKILDSLNLKWKRNWKYFLYVDEKGETRKFYPDFYIEDFDLYLEYKGWLTVNMRNKMKDAKERNSINLLIVVGRDKRYKDDGLIIDELENYLHRCGATVA